LRRRHRGTGAVGIASTQRPPTDVGSRWSAVE
jgi:hypothetical protein